MAEIVTGFCNEMLAVFQVLANGLSLHAQFFLYFFPIDRRPTLEQGLADVLDQSKLLEALVVLVTRPVRIGVTGGCQFALGVADADGMLEGVLDGIGLWVPSEEERCPHGVAFSLDAAYVHQGIDIAGEDTRAGASVGHVLVTLEALRLMMDGEHGAAELVRKPVQVRAELPHVLLVILASWKSFVNRIDDNEGGALGLVVGEDGAHELIDRKPSVDAVGYLEVLLHKPGINAKALGYVEQPPHELRSVDFEVDVQHFAELAGNAKPSGSSGYADAKLDDQERFPGLWGSGEHHLPLLGQYSLYQRAWRLGKLALLHDRGFDVDVGRGLTVGVQRPRRYGSILEEERCDIGDAVIIWDEVRGRRCIGFLRAFGDGLRLCVFNHFDHFLTLVNLVHDFWCSRASGGVSPVAPT